MLKAIAAVILTIIVLFVAVAIATGHSQTVVQCVQYATGQAQHCVTGTGH